MWIKHLVCLHRSAPVAGECTDKWSGGSSKFVSSGGYNALRAQYILGGADAKKKRGTLMRIVFMPKHEFREYVFVMMRRGRNPVFCRSGAERGYVKTSRVLEIESATATRNSEFIFLPMPSEAIRLLFFSK